MSEQTIVETVDSVETSPVEIETDDLTEIIREVLGAIKDDNLTAYAAWVVYSTVGTAVQLAKINPSQYIYNFARNGMIVKEKKGSVKGVTFTKEEVGAWVYRYVTNQIAKQGTK
jgi:F420-0:gamma-glutamyl ligase